MSALSVTRMYHPSGQSPTIPGGLAGWTEPLEITSERRVVTILFCDVVGSTTMAELLDPEEWGDIMNDVYRLMLRPIERYEGTIIRLMGDSILALFGAPHAHEDDPQRAILASLEIVEGIASLQERIRRQHDLEFNVRIGINTGLVVVGAFGADHVSEYTAMGDAINVAARLEEMAKPGTILVGASTFHFAEPFFEFESLGDTGIRGKAKHELIYRVFGKKQPVGRLWDVSGRDLPFTGRDRELDAIRTAVDELRLQRRGRIVAISGEAGVGKTRLVEEALRYVKSRPAEDGGLSVAVLENRVNPHDGNRPYAAVQARFRKVFGIDENDSSEVVRKKFIESTRHFPSEFRERAARVIQRVMALDIDEFSGTNDPEFEPDEFKVELASVVLQIVQGWNPGGAFMLVGEDYHWIDMASMEIVSQLYELLGDAPVLFLFTFRPDPTSPLMNVLGKVRETYTEHLLEINLGPLPSTDAARLVSELTCDDSPEARAIQELILNRSEGNPLFIEELINALVEQEVLVRDVSGRHRWCVADGASDSRPSIPTNLQALLLERIDRLPAGPRRTLQQASVLGRTFSRRLLEEFVQQEASIGADIDMLIDLDMLRPDSGPSEDTLTFRHAMIAEAAYNTILLRHRRQFHLMAGEATERVYSDRQNEHSGDIGYHYYKAQDVRGIGWLVRAAEQAQSVYEPNAVIDYATKAVNLAREQNQEEPLKALLLRGHAMDMIGKFESARDDFQNGVAIARQQESRELEWEALIALGALWAESDYRLAGKLIREALDLARNMNDDTRIAHSLNRLGNWHVNIGEPQIARQYHSDARSIFERQKNDRGLAETIDLLGLSYYLSGDFMSAEASFRESVEMFEDLGDSRGLSSSLAMLAITGGGIDSETSVPADGDFAEWIAYGRRALETADSIGWNAGRAFALIAIGEVFATYGEPGEAIASLERALEIARSVGHRQWSLAAAQTLGSVAIQHFSFERASAYLDESLERARELGSAYWTMWAITSLADLHIARGDREFARELLESEIGPDSSLESLGQRRLLHRRAKLAVAEGDTASAIATADRLQRTVPENSREVTIPELSLVKGQALTTSGQYPAAIRELTAASESPVATRDRSLRLKIEQALAAAHLGAGDDNLAMSHLNRTQELAEQISARLPDGEWRTAFESGVSGLLDFPHSFASEKDIREVIG